MRNADEQVYGSPTQSAFLGTEPDRHASPPGGRGSCRAESNAQRGSAELRPPGLADEKVRPEYERPSPTIDQRQTISGIATVSLPGLVLIKLLANRDQDRVHLRDMIDVGLIGREILAELPPALAARLELLLSESGR